jgi:sec-independent protein translocase protein TatA
MFHMPSLMDWIVIGAIALLLFGKRLPEMGKSLGKGIVEFKKGLQGIEDDVSQTGRSSAPAGRPAPPVVPAPDQQSRLPGDVPNALPPEYKFDPYTGKPINEPKQTTGA